LIIAWAELGDASGTACAVEFGVSGGHYRPIVADIMPAENAAPIALADVLNASFAVPFFAMPFRRGLRV
jgi:hypothetical protein